MAMQLILTYLRPLLLLIMVAGFVMIYRKYPSSYTLGLVIGSAMTLVSTALGIIYAPSAIFGADGNLINASMPPQWVSPLSASLSWIGSIITTGCLVMFAYRLKPQT